MAKRKIKPMLSEDVPEDWYPPNWDYIYEAHPKITREMYNALDNNLKTGIRNFRIQNINSMGRYGKCPEWERLPDYIKGQYGYTKYGLSYKDDFKIYKFYIMQANSPLTSFSDGGDIIDPSERNKIYGVCNVGFWYFDENTHEYEYIKADVLPNGTTMDYVYEIAPAEVVRWQSWITDGQRFEVDDHGYIEYVYMKTSPVCRTIKSKRV